MKKILMVILTVALGFGLALGDLLWASAQEEVTEEFTLEEITVTAQKRAENMQKVAIPMEVLAGADMREMAKTDIEDILNYVSSAIVSRTEDGLRVSIRGMSNDDRPFYNQSNSMPSVAVNMDGVMSNRADQGTSLFDIERVEVLIGPQSTLYASNSPGGIMNVVSASPKLDSYEGSATVTMGNFKLLNFEGIMNAPWGDTIAARVAFSSNKRSGYLTDGTDDEDNKSVRLRTLFQPNDKFSFMATAELSSIGGLGRGGTVAAFKNQDDISNPWKSSLTPFMGLTIYNDTRNRKFYATINWDVGFGTITIVPSYNTSYGIWNSQVEANPPQFPDAFKMYSHTMTREKGGEIRVTSGPDFSFKWIVGANVYHLKTGMYRDREASDEYQNRTVYEDAVAFFGNITYPVTNSLRLVGGMRKSTDKIFVRNQEYKAAMVVFPNPPYMQTFDEKRHSEYDRPDYKVGFEYDLGENSMIYGDYSTSYRVKAWSSANAKPELLKAFSFGAKNRFFDNTLQLNGSAFLYNYSNYSATLQQRVWYDLNNNAVKDRGETSNDSGGSQQGTGRNMGFDLSANWIVTPQDLLNLSVSYINSKWTDLFFDYQYTWSHAVDAAGNVVVVPINDVSYNGKPMNNSPPWTITLNYSHNFLFNNGSSIKPSINVRYQTGYRLDWLDSTYPWSYQEAHKLIDASLAYTNSEGKILLSAFIKNVENYAVKRRYQAGYPNPMTGYSDIGWLSVGNPRTYGITLTIKY